MVANDLSGLLNGGLVISTSIAVLMTIVSLLLLRDIGVLERRLRGATLIGEEAKRPPSTLSEPTADPTTSVLEEKTRFLATISHEMRTPMNGVLGMADLLAGTRIDAEQRTYIDAIKSSGEAMLALIDEILDFSKINAGKLDLVAEPFEVVSVCEGVAELLAPRAHGKGLEIATYVAANVPAWIISDPARFRQVLINLAGNAVKFTEKGGVAIRLDMPESATLRISVTDTGVGIAADRLDAIFEDFEQADGSASRRFGGTGLGLAISKRIVGALGGSIKVASEPGRGSTFTIELPIKKAEGHGAPMQEDKPNLAGKTFFIVSLSKFEAGFIAEYLMSAGALVTLEGDIAAAELAMSDSTFDGVIIDGSLGETATRALAQSAASGGSLVRYVMLSPYERRALGSPSAAGFNGYLIKPVRARSLFARFLDDAPDVSTPRDVREPLGSSRLNLKVMLAEDNEINALLAVRLLQRHGCEAVWITDGLAAVAAFETAIEDSRPFDAILMDIRMPGLDGLTAARQIRHKERLRSIQPTRLIALTANAFAIDQKNCLEAGFDSFVAKPLNQARLLAALTAPANGSGQLARQHVAG